MFQLSEAELDAAKEAIEFHGIDSFFPKARELQHVLDNWEEVRAHVAAIDLHNYQPYQNVRTYVSKNDKLVRPIDRLHIQDLVIYTGLTLIIRDSVEKSRLPLRSKKSFSYRASREHNRLYDTSNNYEKYRQATEERLGLVKTKYVTTIDITDFFPRIYQHRLENALDSFAGTDRERVAGKVLAKKFLPAFSNGTSYGIPTGPFASRVLGEAVLVDVDATLADKGVDFVRWMDDFTIFTKSEAEAKQAIQLLVEWLDRHHGLSINRAKTKIYPKDLFKRDIWKTYDEEHEKFRELIQKMKTDDAYDDKDIDEEAEVEDQDLIEIFDLALRIESLPKYGLIRHLLERVIFRESVEEETRIAIINTAMSKVWDLEPVFDSICISIAREQSISDRDIEKFCKAVLKVISERKIFVAGHLCMWLCWLVGQRMCRKLKPAIKELIADTNDNAVRAEAILCLGEIGDRADIVSIKDNFRNYSPATRIALIQASAKMGKDERGFWRKTHTITDFYEKLAFSQL